MLRFILRRAREQLYAGVAEAGYENLNPAHMLVFRSPGPQGLRPSEIANEMRITKQSVNDLLRHLERHGYLVLDPDPTDGRARVVRLTDKGRVLESVVNDEAQRTEERIGKRLGPRRYAQLCSALEDIVDDLGTDQEEPGV